MTLWTLAGKSLRFHWRAHLGVLLGATLGTAILVGALAVGDSVRESLRQMALARLGGVHLALVGNDRFFRAELADQIAPELKTPVAPVVFLRGTATRQGATDAETTRTGRVQVLGVDARFWQLSTNSKSGLSASLSGAEGVILNDRLARKLNAKAGEEVLLRVDKPSLLSRDAPLSTVEDASVAIRLPVRRIVTDAEFGRFSLEANQIPPFNAFVPLEVLQKQIGMEKRANVLLVGAGQGEPAKPADATAALWKRWQFTDASLDLKELPQHNALELKTDRVFLDPPVGDAATQKQLRPQPILTYFVNELRVGQKTTPYSTVAAMTGGMVPPDMRDDETIITQWLADDVGAKVGDALKLTYWTVGPMRKLEEHSSTFRVRSVVPLAGEAADPDLMPNIPGLADKKDCRDWEPGVPIDLNKIRDKDQAYWSAHRGTPKAYVSLAAGQKLWNNRFGNLTAVRYPMDTRPGQAKTSQAAVELCIRQALSPASLGLFFVPVREQALAAVSQAQDFGQLFIGFSLFLIVAALLLTALLFAFGAEQRSEEVGTLLAVGFPPHKVQRLLLLEGALLASIAAVFGSGVAVLYTKAVVSGLSGVWSGAVASADLQYHAEPKTLVMGALMGFLTALFSLWLVTRRQAKVPARVLLNGELSQSTRATASVPGDSKQGARLRVLPGLPTAVLSLLGALALLISALTAKGNAAETFFGAGALLLIGGMALCRILLGRMERQTTGASASFSLGSLGVRNTVRRRSRSLSAIGLLACGSFLVVSVGASRHDPNVDAEKRDSGTGGFALYGESTLPVYQDLNTAEGQEAFGLDAQQMAGAQVVAMRLREGDEASCLNLNRAQTPRVLGVHPGALRQRKAFLFSQTLEKADPNDPWSLLERTELDGSIPVIADNNTVVWSLGKSLGTTLNYTDDRGRALKLKIVGVMANSVVQGSLLMSENNFIQLFPERSGYRVFLIDAPAAGVAAVSQSLSRGLEDVGLNLTPAPERLADFNAVENTYLSIFAVLGGLGLLLGSVGLGVIVLRNVLERRSELAVLRAIGFRVPMLRWLVFSEHSLLLALGLLVGVAAALVAVLPALRSPGAQVPLLSLSLTLLAVLVNGFVWTGVATTFALRGRLLSALRNE